MKNILLRILRRLAKLTVWRYRPGIIGVTGSAGKTSAKLAIKAVLSQGRSVRASPGNLNSDFGVLLAILGEWRERDIALVTLETPSGTRRAAKLWFWMRVIVSSAWRVAVKTPDYPEILVLEYGADRPGDIKYLLTIARPNVSVITAIGDVPVHVEHYNGPEEVAREKGRLIEFLSVGGFAILNGDDPVVRNLQSRTRARVILYGFDRGEDVRMLRFEHKLERDGTPDGISFKLEYGSSIVPVRIPHVFGRTHAYAAAAAASVGIAFGMNLVTISEALSRYKPADSRMQLVKGVKSSRVIDDAYNASPIAMRFALETLYDLPAKRRIAVLGDMLELGRHADEAHARVGILAAKAADILVAVGPRAKGIAAAARTEGMKKGNIYVFDSAETAKAAVRDLVKAGDLVLVKGSHSMRLGKVVEELRERGTPSSMPL